MYARASLYPIEPPSELQEQVDRNGYMQYIRKTWNPGSQSKNIKTFALEHRLGKGMKEWTGERMSPKNSFLRTGFRSA